MTNEKNSTSKKPRIKLLKKAFGVSACVVFLFSILFPFFHITFLPHGLLPDVLTVLHLSRFLWTFGVQIGSSYFPGTGYSYYWFYDRVFYSLIPGPSLSILFLFMFIAQILTLVTGVLFIQKGRTVYALAAMILSLGVMVSMIYVNLFYAYLFKYANVMRNSIEIGFWLTCLSVFLFLSSFIVSHFSK